jgi:hypothetical protein
MTDTAKNLKIQQYQFFDIPISRKSLPAFMAETFNWIKSNEEKFKESEQVFTLFHNADYKYSSIQFGIKNGFLILSAYGNDEVKAVKAWWRLYSKQKKLQKDNILIISENYKLEILDFFVKYRVKNLLLHRNKKLTGISQEELEQNLEQYIISNFLPFFSHLGYHHDKEKDRIYTAILELRELPEKMKVFKAKKLKAYDIVFKANIKLPKIFAIGQSTAMGYGRVFNE